MTLNATTPRTMSLGIIALSKTILSMATLSIVVLNRNSKCNSQHFFVCEYVILWRHNTQPSITSHNDRVTNTPAFYGEVLVTAVKFLLKNHLGQML